MQTSASTMSKYLMPPAPRARGFAHIRPVTFYGPEDVIYAQGERAGLLYRIEYGAVRIYRLLADGRRQVVAFYLTGETFGFEVGGMNSFYAEAMVNTGLTTVEYLPDGTFGVELVEIALKAMVRAQEHLLVVGRQNSLEKVSIFLAEILERQGGGDVIDLPMSRTDIGDYLGLTIETVSRSISKLRDMGVIRLRSARCVVVLKLDKLHQIGEHSV